MRKATFTAPRHALLVVFAALLAACGSRPTAPSPEGVHTTLAKAAVPPRVAILSVDGLRPDALTQAGAFHIQGLADRGAYTWHAQTVLPAITLPSHASMLSGYLPAVHGCIWGHYEPARGSIRVPTVLGLARTAGMRTVMVVGKEKFQHLNPPGSVDTFILAGSDEEVAAQAVVQARSGFGILFVHLPDTDLSGHASGWMSQAYLAQVARTDAAVGRVLAALPAGTTVILSADHGGNGRSHGANVASDVTIPWVIAGPRVASRALSQRVHTTDTAATAAYVLGLPLPPGATGRPVSEAFDESSRLAAVAADP